MNKKSNLHIIVKSRCYFKQMNSLSYLNQYICSRQGNQQVHGITVSRGWCGWKKELGGQIYILHVLSEIILIPGTGKNASLIHLLCQSCDMLHNVFAKRYHFMPLKCRFRFHLHTIKISSWWFLAYSRGYAFITTS